MIQLFLSFLAGLVTVASPCILPLLPFLLGASVGKTNKLRPMFIVIGFVLAFSGAAILLSLVTKYANINSSVIRNVGIGFIGLFGVLLVWPKPFESLSLKFTPFISKISQRAGLGNTGNISALVLGASLGIVWTPCAGPVLASILALVLLQQNLGMAFALLLSYAIGVGLPMLVIAYGGQYVSTKVAAIAKHSKAIEKAFGVIIILAAVAMYNNWDTQFYAQFSNTVSQSQEQIPQDVGLKNYGRAPEFVGQINWVNSEPLRIADLRGKVVLVDFWTYSCINCIRTSPYLVAWHEKYADEGLVIIGVHTPEFLFETDEQNVRNALEQFGIEYPVVQDNRYDIWNAYNNRYWPAKYLIDKDGSIVYQHFGEGEYEETENHIRHLLSLSRGVTGGEFAGPFFEKIASPEMYFGTLRIANLVASQTPAISPKTYALPKTISLNEFALAGKWQFSTDKAALVENGGTIKLRFHSADLFMVASSPELSTVKITVDGQPRNDVLVKEAKLYTLFDSDDYSEHLIEIQIDKAGFEAFTFTFG